MIDYLSKNMSNIIDYISNYKYKDEIAKIYESINSYIGYRMDFTGLYHKAKSNISINTFVNVYNFMNSHCFFYSIEKMNITTLTTMSNYLYCYPTDVSNIIKSDDDIEKKNRKVVETLIIAKLRTDGHSVFKAVYRDSETTDSKGLLNTFIIDRKCLVKIYLQNKEESLRNYLQYKSLLPRFVLINDDIESTTDRFGVTYIGIKTFFRKGLIVND